MIKNTFYVSSRKKQDFIPCDFEAYPHDNFEAWHPHILKKFRPVAKWWQSYWNGDAPSLTSSRWRPMATWVRFQQSIFINIFRKSKIILCTVQFNSKLTTTFWCLILTFYSIKQQRPSVNNGRYYWVPRGVVVHGKTLTCLKNGIGADNFEFEDFVCSKMGISNV